MSASPTNDEPVDKQTDEIQDDSNPDVDETGMRSFSGSDCHSLIEMYFPQQVPSLRLPSSAAVAVPRARKTRRTPTPSRPASPPGPRRRPGRRGSGEGLPRYVVCHHQFEHQPGFIWSPPGPIVLRILPLSRALDLSLLYCSFPLSSPLARLLPRSGLAHRMQRLLTELPSLISRNRRARSRPSPSGRAEGLRRIPNRRRQQRHRRRPLLRRTTTPRRASRQRRREAGRPSHLLPPPNEPDG